MVIISCWILNSLNYNELVQGGDNLNKAIKSGKKSISYKYLEGFCKALNCSFDEIMEVVDK